MYQDRIYIAAMVNVKCPSLFTFSRTFLKDFIETMQKQTMKTVARRKPGKTQPKISRRKEKQKGIPRKTTESKAQVIEVGKRKN